jgi:hypothetical protein
MAVLFRRSAEEFLSAVKHYHAKCIIPRLPFMQTTLGFAFCS